MNNLKIDGIFGHDTRMKFQEVYGDYSIIESNGVKARFFNLNGNYGHGISQTPYNLNLVGYSEKPIGINLASDSMVFEKSSINTHMTLSFMLATKFFLIFFKGNRYMPRSKAQ